MTDDEQDRAEIYDLFNRYADAVAGRQWRLLDDVFTEDVISNWPGSAVIEGRTALVRRIRGLVERTYETHVLGNYTATIDGDEAEASVRVRVHGIGARDPSRLPQKILGLFRARVVRTPKGWRFRQFGAARYSKLDTQATGMIPTGREIMVPAGAA